MLRAGGGGGAAGVGVVGEGDLTGGGGPRGTAHALLVVEVRQGELLVDIIVGGEPVVLAGLGTLLLLLVVAQGHVAVGKPAHATTVQGVPYSGVRVQNTQSDRSILYTVSAHFGTRALQGRGPSGL